ncbi:hypothetical protein [Methylobacter sp.]|uniref:hypothetical protein n=1 Tax=Methylobacter sp. TaxID=2051955 RepID=UPI003DA2AA1E
MFYSTAEDIKSTYRANPVPVNGIIAQGQISRHLSRYVQDNHRRAQIAGFAVSQAAALNAQQLGK